jgi:hypothetical protein
MSSYEILREAKELEWHWGSAYEIIPPLGINREWYARALFGSSDVLGGYYTSDELSKVIQEHYSSVPLELRRSSGNSCHDERDTGR